MMSTQQHTANSQLDQRARAHKSSESCTNSAIDMPSSGRPIRNQNGTHADINNNNNNNNSMDVNTTNSNSTKTSGTGKNRNIIASHYQIAQKIGEGSFGIIFKGYDLLRSNQPIAIKFESRKSEAPQLKDEFRAYKILNNAIKKYYENYERERHRYLSINGIPKVYYFGQEGYYNVLIIQLLGPSLEDLFEWCGRKFSVPTVSRLAIQMIERLQFLHENHMIYRDIKPDNFLIGATTADNTIYMVDYGMVKQYRDPITHVHIPYRERKSLSGTARYMSINTHLGREQSRRDDLESLGNVFVYFLKGQLPWQGLKAPTNKLKYEKIGEKKQRIPISELCSGLPLQVGEYVRQVRNLKFDEDPDYITYINLFKSILDEIENPNYSEGSIQSANSTATAISQLTSNTMKQFPGQFSSNSATINSAAQELKNLDLEHYEYDWMRLNDGQGWSWNKNKKINLNGYGSGVRHTNTQQTQQLDANHQSHNTHYNDNNINSKNKRTRSNGQFQKKTAKTRAVSAGGPANERSGLLANGDYANRYTQDGFEDYDTGNNGRNRSVFSWLCCCFI